MKTNRNIKNECRRNHGIQPPFMKKIAFGAVFIVAGCLLLGFNTGLLPEEYRWLVFSWQSLLIAIGFISLIGNGSYVGGSILIMIGSFFMLHQMHHFNTNFFDIAFPIFLIIIGLLFLSKKFIHKRNCRVHDPSGFSSTMDYEEGVINETNIFNGNKQKITSDKFRGGSSTNLFGGSEIDFTNSILADGDNVFEITCVFGGMSLVVPDEWNVEVRLTPIFGGIDDKRHVLRGMTYDPQKKLIITGTLVFGGVEIKSSKY